MKNPRPGLQGRLSCGFHRLDDDGDDDDYGAGQFDDFAVVVDDRDANDDMASSMLLNY